MGKIQEGKKVKKIHYINNLRFDKNTLFIEIDGRNYSYPLKSISSRLLDATAEERNMFEISPSGYGISWQIIDEDLSVDGLINSSKKPKISQTVKIPY